MLNDDPKTSVIYPHGQSNLAHKIDLSLVKCRSMNLDDLALRKQGLLRKKPLRNDRLVDEINTLSTL